MKYASKSHPLNLHVVDFTQSNLYSRHTHPGDLSFHKHHGQGRESDVDKLQTADIVLTTYATVATEFCRGKSSLAKVKWFRIVLDESKNSMRSLFDLYTHF
jgi:SNF2 family DNA or RNA helicase